MALKREPTLNHLSLEGCWDQPAVPVQDLVVTWESNPAQKRTFMTQRHSYIEKMQKIVMPIVVLDHNVSAASGAVATPIKAETPSSSMPKPALAPPPAKKIKINLTSCHNHDVEINMEKEKESETQQDN